MLHRFATRYQLITMAVGACALSLSGCRQQIYHELYAEQSASEIRALEDRIIEYDSEFRALEQELWSVEEENARMKAQLDTSRGLPKSSSKPGVVEETEPIEPSWSLPAAPSSKPSTPRANPGKTPDEVIDLGPKGGQPNKDATKPKDDRSLLQQGKGNDDDQAPNVKKNQLMIPPGENTSPESPANNPNDDPAIELNTPPALEKPIENSEETMKAPEVPALPSLDPNNNLKNLPGNDEPLPPPNNFPQDRDRASNSGRIVVPGMDNNPIRQASAVAQVQEEVADPRMVELAFHPTLCRGNNGDSESGNDGLFLVLQPQNAKHQFLPVAAELTIIAEDPARPEDAARIGRWVFTPAELQELMQAHGSGQGFHLTLPWQEVKPEGDRVHVWVRYRLPDGRLLRNDRVIVLNRKGAHRSLWTPKVSTPAADGH